MSVSKSFKKFFSKKRLNKIYFSEIRYKSAPGIDRINTRSFEKRLVENIDIVYRKVHNGTYRFSQYREKLLSRGQNKHPRVISIPTIRDKLTQRALFEILHSVYNSAIPFLRKIIDEVSLVYRLGVYDSVLRLDVTDFYPSIKHDLLLKEIRKKIRKKEILHLIKNAISQTTVARSERKSRGLTSVGVPQGLSISNILANVYMSPLDSKYSNTSSYKYFRYVDDILIFCDSKDLQNITDEITNDCDVLGLKLHTKDDDSLKVSSGKIAEGFSYLGYVFNNLGISVRKKSVVHLQESIIKILTNYKYSDPQALERLKWRLNTRITGCVFNNTKYGWLFFFSQIDDLALLNSLDHFVVKQLKRFGLDQSNIKIKRFVRAFHEIRKNMSNTTYIPNFDKLSIAEKRRLLAQVFDLQARLMKPGDIEYQFKKKIYRTVKELEEDLERPS